MIEEVVVQTVEVPLGIVGQYAELIGVLCRYARMVMSRLVGILDEQDVVDDA